MNFKKFAERVASEGYGPPISIRVSKANEKGLEEQIAAHPNSILSKTLLLESKKMGNDHLIVEWDKLSEEISRHISIMYHMRSFRD